MYKPYELPTSRLSKVIAVETDRRTDTHTGGQLEMMAITMNCNLRPPDVASVVLRYFQSYLYRACAETVTSQHPVKIAQLLSGAVVVMVLINGYN